MQNKASGTFAITHSHSHAHGQKESVQDTYLVCEKSSPWIQWSSHFRCLCGFSVGEGWSLGNISPRSIVVIWRFSEYSLRVFWLCEASLRGRMLFAACCGPGELLWTTVYRVARVCFSHINFQYRPQSKSLTFSEGLISKILLHFICYSCKKNKFPGLFIKKQKLVRQH